MKHLTGQAVVHHLESKKLLECQDGLEPLR